MEGTITKTIAVYGSESSYTTIAEGDENIPPYLVKVSESIEVKFKRLSEEEVIAWQIKRCEIEKEELSKRFKDELETIQNKQNSLALPAKEES